MLTLAFSIVLQAQEKIIIRIENPDQFTVKKFNSENYDIAAYKPGDFIDLVVTQQEYEKLMNLGYQAEIIKTEAEMAANLGDIKDIDGYRTYDECLAELQQIENDYPGLCKLYDIGDSRGKEYYNAGNSNYENYQHDVWVLKLSDNVETEEDEPSVYYFGAHHAREPLSTEVTMKVLNHLLNNYGNDPQITENVNNTQIWFVPIVNPDGHEVVLNQLDLWWRKNIRDNDENGQITFSGGWDYPDGVDPNRNYGWEWGGQGASSDPNDQTYRGPGPFSEPELQATRDLMGAHHFVAGISYHTYSELVLWPYGYSSNIYAPDVDAIAALGTAMGQVIPSLYGGHYTPQPAWQLYPAAGNTDDYAYGKHGIFSYCIELGTEFIPPANTVYQICEDNIESTMILLNRINFSTLTGHVTNASTGDPIVAEIFIEGIDDTGAPRDPYCSNEEFGTYYRMLENDNYSVKVSSFGYITQTFENININSQEQTILDVALEPSQIITVSGTVTDADTGEPIENASVEVLNTPLDPVTTNENGEYIIPEIFENTYNFKVFALNYATILWEETVTPENNIIDFELTETNAVSFESGYFGGEWSFGGNADWVIDNTVAWDGNNSARSGNIGDNQTSQLYIALDVASDGYISFYRKVSSEAGYDYLQFFIDNSMKEEWAGELDWEEKSFQVSAGTHTFKWVYEKDTYVSNGDDCGWIDFIIFPPLASVNAQAGPDGEICENETFQCQGSASYYTSVKWTTSGDGSFSDTTILNPIYSPGTNDIFNGTVTLTLTAFDNTGNSDSDDLILIINPLPGPCAAISGSQEVCAGTTEIYSSSSQYASQYDWLLTPEEAGTIENNGQSCNISWTDGWFGIAILKVRGENDCGFGEFSDDLEITVNDCTGIDDENTLNFEIYPNPAKDKITIQFNKTIPGEINVTLLNMLGTTVFTCKIKSSQNILKNTFDISDVEDGIYFLKIIFENRIVTRKLVIRK